MRKFLRAAASALCIVLTCACAVGAYALFHTPVFRGADRYFFSAEASSSSACVSSDDPVFGKLLLGRVAGESAAYTGNRYLQLKEEFGATLLFCERACGVSNYYLYSPKLKHAVYLNGHAVNLHIAVRGDTTAAGTPLIFGGF